ncbi:4-(cytidine 5'-diphospho)-2-C-methyl-D-erythritol kinase [Candidatus Pelagibacter sp.]|nr:4-(cytidine 5'-diphospho)-2-C-methyl-D-erythritol kinase [Candidatus Pelagibacter sp.]
MSFSRIKSYAKLNLALNIVGKNKFLHKIESIIAFVNLYDTILIKKSKFKKHKISFTGKFSKNIDKKNTISKLLQILEERKLIKNQNFHIKINKKIPSEAGLGGGSMNAASILKYFIKKKIIKINKKETSEVAKLIGSDVILGLNTNYSILTAKNKIKHFTKIKKIYVLIVKPNFGCSTKDIYSKVRNFDKPKFNKPSKKMFNYNNLINMKNSLEPIVFNKYPKLKRVKLDLEKSSNPIFVRMTGSGSAIAAYFQSKERCEHAKKSVIKKYRNYWCIASKTI